LLAVTTFKPSAFDLYAEKCLQGLAEFFPGKVIAYVEEPVEVDGVEVRDLFSIPGCKTYLEKIRRVHGYDGKGTGQYDFRFNCNAFCRKVFAQDHVFDEDDLVFWIDADSVVKKPIPESFLTEMMDGVPLAYMGRRRTYTETGFVGFNTKHEDFQKFRERYLSWFTSGKVFQQLKGWHDCIAFDLAREGIKGRNLSPAGEGYGHVMQHTVLEPYLTHLKGNRKYASPVGSEAPAHQL
jgi:hypothetical protein